MRNFILFTLVLFIMAALLRVEFFFTIFYLFIGVYLASRYWARHSLRHLQVTRTLPERVFLGEEITVKLQIHNRSFLPVPWLQINESFSTVLASPPFHQRVLSLDGRETVTLSYTLSARRRGFYSIGPMQAETGDLLGIHHSLQGTVKASHLIIYPKIIPVVQLKLPTHSPQAVLPTVVPLFRDTTRLTGVKDYVPGDNPRHIHWPASARRGHPLIKKFETAIDRDCAILLNLDQTSYGRSGQAAVAVELAIVVAASLANHIINRESLPVGLYTTGLNPETNDVQDFRLGPDKGQAQLMRILEVLARIERHPDDVAFATRLQHHALHLSWGATAVIITSMETEELLEQLLVMKRAGYHIALVLVQPAAYVYPAGRLVRKLNLPVIRITGEKDIERWQPGR
jgi:uncharacterized protein (DUF58 family)